MDEEELMQQLMLAQVFGALPELSTRGAMQPDDLGTQNTSLTMLGKQFNMLDDPMLMALAGMGSFDASTFAPTVEQKPVDQPGRRTMEAWLQRDPASIEYMIADEIRNGGTPETFVAMARKKGLIPRDPENPDDETKFDLRVEDRLLSKADSLFNGLTSDPELPYEETVTQSPQAEKFRALGLPQPTEQYTPQYLDPGAGERQSGIAELLAQQTQARDAMRLSRDAVGKLATAPPRFADGAPLQWNTGGSGAGFDQGILTQARADGLSVGDSADLAERLGPPSPKRSGTTFVDNDSAAPNIKAPSRADLGKSTQQNLARDQAAWKAAMSRANKARGADTQARGRAQGASESLMAQGRTPTVDAIAERQAFLRRIMGR
jgi:hypothetical protein